MLVITNSHVTENKVGAWAFIIEKDGNRLAGYGTSKSKANYYKMDLLAVRMALSAILNDEEEWMGEASDIQILTRCADVDSLLNQIIATKAMPETDEPDTVAIIRDSIAGLQGLDITLSVLDDTDVKMEELSEECLSFAVEAANPAMSPRDTKINTMARAHFERLEVANYYHWPETDPRRLAPEYADVEAGSFYTVSAETDPRIMRAVENCRFIATTMLDALEQMPAEQS